eukprot:s633_g31.t1
MLHSRATSSVMIHRRPSNWHTSTLPSGKRKGVTTQLGTPLVALSTTSGLSSVWTTMSTVVTGLALPTFTAFMAFIAVLALLFFVAFMAFIAVLALLFFVAFMAFIAVLAWPPVLACLAFIAFMDFMAFIAFITFVAFGAFMAFPAELQEGFFMGSWIFVQH